MTTVGTGSGGSLTITAAESAHDSAARTWSIHVVAQVGTPSGTFGNPMGSWSVQKNGSDIASGSWSTASDANTETLYDATVTVSADADGTGSVTFGVYIGATDTIGVGGPTSTSVTLSTSGGSLTTLKVAPQAPTGVTATRVSDTQTALAWVNHWASNGAATSEKVLCSVNGATATEVGTIAPATSVNVACAGNQKLIYSIRAINSYGSATSDPSNTLYTTPAAPSGVTATKDASGNVAVTYVDNVAFAEHVHVVQAASSTDGGVTFGAYSTLTSASTGGAYTHTAPDPAKVWKYNVYALNTDAAGLASAGVESNSVQLLAAPNKPTFAALATFADKAKDLAVGWTHNPADTTPQKYYEFGYSTNGGTSWSSSGKITSATPSRTIAASTYAASVTLTIRVRTWGSASTGGSDGTGASPWSDVTAVTFKTRPTTTITQPANASTYAKAALDVRMTFAQAESATFVSAAIELWQGAVLVESFASTALTPNVLASRVANGGSYSVKVTVTDSNGIASDTVVSAFSVSYTKPVAASVIPIYLDEVGVGQLYLTIPAPGVGEVAASTVTITRTIDGDTETVDEGRTAASTLTILDMTPTTYGDNVYTVTTISADGAETSVVATLTVAEDEWAFLSKGDDFSKIVKFSGELKPTAKASVDSALVKTAGRKRAIGLYGTTADFSVSGTGEIVTGLGSSPSEIEQFLLIPGKGCYRDPTGRRIFGRITSDGVTRQSHWIATFPYQVEETS